MLPIDSLAARLDIAPVAYQHYVTRLRSAGLIMTIEDSATSTTLLAPANPVELRALLRTLDEPPKERRPNEVQDVPPADPPP